MGRKIRTGQPSYLNRLNPKGSDLERVRAVDSSLKSLMKKNYDRKDSAKIFKALKICDRVRVITNHEKS